MFGRTSTFLRARDITEVGRIAGSELDEAAVSDGCTPARRMAAYDPEVELLPCESGKDVELDMDWIVLECRIQMRYKYSDWNAEYVLKNV